MPQVWQTFCPRSFTAVHPGGQSADPEYGSTIRNRYVGGNRNSRRTVPCDPRVGNPSAVWRSFSRPAASRGIPFCHRIRKIK
jgi:hypothetical protein